MQSGEMCGWNFSQRIHQLHRVCRTPYCWGDFDVSVVVGLLLFVLFVALKENIPPVLAQLILASNYF